MPRSSRSQRPILVALVLSAALAGACTPTVSADSSPVSAPAAVPAVSAPAPAASGSTYARPAKAELEARLTPMQFDVTQNAGTEPPFQNEYWDNHKDGLYVDVATGEPLFSSRDKFESGTGWPSFTRPIDPAHVVERSDTSVGRERTEVLSSGGGSHLGHVFNDGPEPTGKRFCINSASLRFIPVEQLAAAGYGAYAPLFGAQAAPANR